jgi:hypothetical protein
VDAQRSAETEYDFLLGRHINAVLANRWGVHPHQALVANGWLTEDDYYRALAEAAGLPFKAQVTAHDAILPAKASPRQDAGPAKAPCETRQQATRECPQERTRKYSCSF